MRPCRRVAACRRHPCSNPPAAAAAAATRVRRVPHSSAHVWQVRLHPRGRQQGVQKALARAMEQRALLQDVQVQVAQHAAADRGGVRAAWAGGIRAREEGGGGGGRGCSGGAGGWVVGAGRRGSVGLRAEWRRVVCLPGRPWTPRRGSPQHRLVRAVCVVEVQLEVGEH